MREGFPSAVEALLQAGAKPEKMLDHGDSYAYVAAVDERKKILLEINGLENLIESLEKERGRRLLRSSKEYRERERLTRNAEEYRDVLRFLLLHTDDPQGGISKYIRTYDTETNDSNIAMQILRQVMQSPENPVVDLGGGKTREVSSFCSLINKDIIEKCVSYRETVLALNMFNSCREKQEEIFKNSYEKLTEYSGNGEGENGMLAKMAVHFGYDSNLVRDAWNHAVKTGSRFVVGALLAAMDPMDDGGQQKEEKSDLDSDDDVKKDVDDEKGRSVADRDNLFNQFTLKERREQLMLAAKKKIPLVLENLLAYDPSSGNFRVIYRGKEEKERYESPFCHSLLDYPDALEIFLKNQENDDWVNSKETRFNETMLHLAVEKDDAKLINMLVFYGADPLTKVYIEMTAGGWIIQELGDKRWGLCSKLNSLEKLIYEFAEKNKWGFVEKFLVIASEVNKKIPVKILSRLLRIASENERDDMVPVIAYFADKHGISIFPILEKAITRKNADLVPAVLAEEALRKEKSKAWKNREGELRDLLRLAITKGEPEIVESLIRNYRNNIDGIFVSYSALHQSIGVGSIVYVENLKTFKLLVKHVKDVNKVDAADTSRKDYTPLQYLVDRWLLSNAPAPARSDDKNTDDDRDELQKAYKQAVLTLLEHGADPRLGPCWHDNYKYFSKERPNEEKRQKLERLREWVWEMTEQIFRDSKGEKVIRGWAKGTETLKGNYKDLVNLMTEYLSLPDPLPQEEN